MPCQHSFFERGEAVRCNGAHGKPSVRCPGSLGDAPLATRFRRHRAQSVGATFPASRYRLSPVPTDNRPASMDHLGTFQALRQYLVSPFGRRDTRQRRIAASQSAREIVIGSPSPPTPRATQHAQRRIPVVIRQMHRALSGGSETDRSLSFSCSLANSPRSRFWLETQVSIRSVCTPLHGCVAPLG
ncbi:hypothetical protein LZ30DRAFT_342036 [Colletotrichum cereale]|nr:hypothetical protein LZ30DRAFT_342036 [Colletotrichum cereale]